MKPRNEMKQSKELIEKTGMELTDEEMDMASGGAPGDGNGYIFNGSTDGYTKQDNGTLTNGKNTIVPIVNH